MSEKSLEEQVSNIGHDAYEEASSAVKRTLIRVHKETDSKNGADATRAGLYGGLGALVPCALLLAKRRDMPKGLAAPKKPSEVVPEHGNFIYEMATPETLTFAGLVLAQMLEKITYDTTSIAFGPMQFREALVQWKKVFPNTKPEDWIDECVLKAINDLEQSSIGPVEEMMAKLRKAPPGTPTVH